MSECSVSNPLLFHHEGIQRMDGEILDLDLKVFSNGQQLKYTNSMNPETPLRLIGPYFSINFHETQAKFGETRFNNCESRTVEGNNCIL